MVALLEFLIHRRIPRVFGCSLQLCKNCLAAVWEPMCECVKRFWAYKKRVIWREGSHVEGSECIQREWAA